MKKRINRVNLYHNTKNVVVSNTFLAMMSGLGIITSMMATGYSGYITVTNPEVLKNTPFGVLITITCATITTAFILSEIDLLKKTREVLKLYKDAQIKLDQANEEDKEQIVIDYCESLDKAVHSLKYNKKKN